jgi:hypothetical protein
VENIQMQEAYRTPKCHDQKWNTSPDM